MCGNFGDPNVFTREIERLKADLAAAMARLREEAAERRTDALAAEMLKAFWPGPHRQPSRAGANPGESRSRRTSTNSRG